MQQIEFFIAHAFTYKTKEPRRAPDLRAAGAGALATFEFLLRSGDVVRERNALPYVPAREGSVIRRRRVEQRTMAHDVPTGKSMALACVHVAVFESPRVKLLRAKNELRCSRVVRELLDAFWSHGLLSASIRDQGHIGPLFYATYTKGLFHFPMLTFT